LPAYLTTTAWAGTLAPWATVPNATAPGFRLTSLRLLAWSLMTAVETNFGPKVT
jgi:hypothetical protein